jgi:hypothetical protein
VVLLLHGEGKSRCGTLWTGGPKDVMHAKWCVLTIKQNKNRAHHRYKANAQALMDERAPRSIGR